VDEVHTLTSLSGLEALLRQKKVSCYGQPFYAGWGLTMDHAPIARRNRKLQLDELVAGALILYPTYVSRVSGCFTTPERAVEELVAWRAIAPSSVPLWRKVLRPLLYLQDRRRVRPAEHRTQMSLGAIANDA
jgi:capsular polysaccharide export protein